MSTSNPRALEIRNARILERNKTISLLVVIFALVCLLGFVVARIKNHYDITPSNIISITVAKETLEQVEEAIRKELK